MTVYLGAPDSTWLLATDKPLMVSHNRLRRLTRPYSYPVSHGEPWVLDSGAYTLITKFGAFPDSAEDYVRAVRRYDITITNLRWAAPQDMPCEPAALTATGASIDEHLDFTVQSYLDDTMWWERLAPHRPSPFRPIVQGWLPEDYERCCDKYERRGVDLSQPDVVGVGSVCTRERTDAIVDIVERLRARISTRLHGYGVHAHAIGLFDDIDSQAWSAAARWRRIKDPQCTAFHAVCSSCVVYAERWHDDLTTKHIAARAARHPIA